MPEAFSRLISKGSLLDSIGSLVSTPIMSVRPLIPCPRPLLPKGVPRAGGQEGEEVLFFFLAITIVNYSLFSIFFVLVSYGAREILLVFRGNRVDSFSKWTGRWVSKKTGRLGRLSKETMPRFIGLRG